MLKDEVALKILACSDCAFTSFIVFLLVNRFPNKLAPNVPNNIVRNPHFCSFASLTSFINKPDYLRNVTISIISFISAVEIINVVLRKAKSEGQRADTNDF